jgi:hypothetical protein
MTADCLHRWGILVVLLGLLSTQARAQGIVNFGNRFLPQPPDRRVYYTDPSWSTPYMGRTLRLNSCTGTMWVSGLRIRRLRAFIQAVSPACKATVTTVLGSHDSKLSWEYFRFE